MKYSEKTVSAIVVIGVLLIALGVGLAIREARISRAEAKAREIKQAQLNMLRRGGKSARPTVENKAALKEQKALALEKMAAMTDQQKEEFKVRMGDGFSGEPKDVEVFRYLSPEERTKLVEKWANMTPEEREALKTKMRQDAESRRKTIVEKREDAPTEQQAGLKTQQTGQMQQGSSEVKENK